jgi:hypothetical protein
VNVRAVIAGNYAEYLDWCHEHGINPRGRDVFYATPESLRGRRNLTVVRTGTYAQRDDLAEIGQILRYTALVSG